MDMKSKKKQTLYNLELRIVVLWLGRTHGRILGVDNAVFLTQGRLHCGFSLSFILRIYIVDYTKNKNINKLWRVTRDQLRKALQKARWKIPKARAMQQEGWGTDLRNVQVEWRGQINNCTSSANQSRLWRGWALVQDGLQLTGGKEDIWTERNSKTADFRPDLPASDSSL